MMSLAYGIAALAVDVKPRRGINIKGNKLVTGIGADSQIHHVTIMAVIAAIFEPLLSCQGGLVLIELTTIKEGLIRVPILPSSVGMIIIVAITITIINRFTLRLFIFFDFLQY